MKKRNFFVALPFAVLLWVSCNGVDDTRRANADSLRADSLWKVAIADSINQARNHGEASHGEDTGLGNDLESITRGMKDGLNQVQSGLDKVKKITEVSEGTRKTVAESIKKTRDAVNKTVDEARKTIHGEK